MTAACWTQPARIAVAHRGRWPATALPHKTLRVARRHVLDEPRAVLREVGVVAVMPHGAAVYLEHNRPAAPGADAPSPRRARGVRGGGASSSGPRVKRRAGSSPGCRGRARAAARPVRGRGLRALWPCRARMNVPDASNAKRRLSLRATASSSSSRPMGKPLRAHATSSAPAGTHPPGASFRPSACGLWRRW